MKPNERPIPVDHRIYSGVREREGVQLQDLPR